MSRFFDDLEQQLHEAAQREIASAEGASPPQSWWRRPRALALLAVGAAGLATPAIARVTGIWNPGVRPGPPARTVTAGTPSSGLTCTDNSGPQAAVITNASPSTLLTNILGVLRRPYSSEDQFPALRLPQGLAALNGAAVNPHAIRFLGTAGRKSYFAVPIAGSAHVPAHCRQGLTARQRHNAEASQPPPITQPRICLLSSTGSGGCGGSPGELRERGAQIGIGTAANETIVAGLVPDGVTAVTITYGRSHRTFAIHNNFLSYVVAVGASRAPNAVVWHFADGSARRVP